MKTKVLLADNLDKSAKKILDLGGGTGLELIHLFELFPDSHVTVIDITENMLEAASWGNGLTSGETKSGVNYLLNVKLNKQAISVSATLANWNTVEATGNSNTKSF